MGGADEKGIEYPLASINFYGGAERGINTSAGPLGGTEWLGVVPLVGNFGFQSSLGWEGGNDVFRTLVGGGPLYSYSSGKFGLFVQYEYKQTPLAKIGPMIPQDKQDRGG